MKTPILGQAYVARSVNAAANRMVNLFPEVVPEAGKERGFLNRAPGLRFLQRVGAGPIRALWVDQLGSDYFYIVSGSEVFRTAALTLPATKIGDVNGSGPVSIADNGTQLFFACNPSGFIYDRVSNTLQQITDPDFPGAVTVGYLDGYFVFNEPVSQKLWVTELLDGSSIDALDFASAEGAPDNLASLIGDHREVWLFGSDSVEVWYNAGAADFPLLRVQGAFNEIGIAAPYSMAKLDNGLFWLGADARGQGIVYRASGYAGQRVSTHAVEYAIAQYDSISDAVAYTYQQEGHAFYVLTFPTANKTWVFDVSTQAWHERAGFESGVLTRHRSNCQCNFRGTTVVGDFENGNIYAFDLGIYSDNSLPQKWLRSWRAIPTGQNNLKRSTHHSLQLDCEVGSPFTSGQEAQVMLRWSDDGGHTWSNEHWTSMGAVGEYAKRVIWRRLGMTTKLRDRVYEISGTDDVKIAIMGAELVISGTNA